MVRNNVNTRSQLINSKQPIKYFSFSVALHLYKASAVPGRPTCKEYVETSGVGTPTAGRQGHGSPVTKGDRGGIKGAENGWEIKAIVPCNAAAGCNECRTLAPGPAASRATSAA
jgi:hypothetical protein